MARKSRSAGTRKTATLTDTQKSSLTQNAAKIVREKPVQRAPIRLGWMPSYSAGVRHALSMGTEEGLALAKWIIACAPEGRRAKLELIQTRATKDDGLGELRAIMPEFK